ncbi:cytoskeleton-associated protein 2 isoform X1 [Apteryx mantelli]|uniref:Cytoskeleton-associated protein 2 isoform X1 n=1 Tax=Apteryx mantelli TaxID=2696672 RepID=A0ABM4DZ27_9AVES
MTARPSPRLPPSRRSEPAYREQRRQKVEEYLSRKKIFSGVCIQENQASFSSSRTGKVTSNKLQDKIQALKSAKPKMEDTENADKLSWDQSSRTLEENVTLKSSTISRANSTLGTSYNLEDLTSKDKVTEIKPQHVSLSQSFLHVRSIKEKQLIAEKQNSIVSLPKKPVPGTYRGKVIQSKVNSFRKAPKSEGEKSSLPDKKPLISATKPSVRSLSTSNCNVVMKTIKVTNSPNSVKPKGVLPFQSKPASKALNSQSSLNKQQSTSAVSLTKVTVQKMIGRRGPVPRRAASNNSDHKTLAVKLADSCEDARPEATAKAISVVPVTKSGQDLKAIGNRKSVLPKESAEERRARLAEWRASKGKVMRRPPASVSLGAQSKSEAQEFSSTDDSLEHLLHGEKVNKTLSECLQLTEQGCQSDEVRAMLEDLIKNIPGAKKLAKYWICCMHLEQMGPLEKLIVVYEEAVLAGAMPKDELRHTLIDIMKNTESLFKSEDGGAVIEAHLSEVVEVGKEANASAEQVQEVFKDLNSDEDQKAERNKAETSNEAIKNEEMDLDLKPREEILPKKNKKHKTKERTKKSGKCETEEQNEDRVKDVTRALNSPDKENDASYLMKYNLSTTPYLESMKMHHEANDSNAKDLKIVTPLRYSQRIREKMCKLSDTVKDHDPCVSSLEQLGELGSKLTACIHRQNNALKETNTDVEE